nr:MAG TPA: hypothetical protein [Caudoviricetes sp.]
MLAILRRQISFFYFHVFFTSQTKPHVISNTGYFFYPDSCLSYLILISLFGPFNII